MMESEWHEHLEHDEFHLKKWGCTAMGSLTKCDQQIYNKGWFWIFRYCYFYYVSVINDHS